MTYAILTFGCRVNQADSFGFERDLRSRGASAGSVEQADLVVVNTCSVTATADQGARQAIRRIARVNPTARIVVTGCYATRRPADLENLPGVVRIVGNDDKERLVAAVGLELGVPTDGGDADGGCGQALGPGVQGRTVYPLKVQTGCNEPCSYCVIPSTRGRSRSRPLPEIIAEADRAAGSGFRELMLTGVHLGSYGRDLRPAGSLAGLLRALDRRGADVRFRLSSIEPMDCTSDVIDVIAASGRFASHVHLPVQHASDRMLRAMRRPYTAGFFRRLIDTVHARLPDASIGTDLLVGFPGEAECDFQWSVTLLEQSPLAYVHVFPYSDRPGTAAASMGPKVHGETVRARADALRDRGRALARRFEASQVGRLRRGLTLEDG
ncbi:MAG: MiaB/RimO family radical SAM methylthiotransferase, partial [Planctomycetes bacterium]|nr:MiaB/RimO family radical SAM methylthiotransferase [Planctomycetota bacterium]